MLDVEVQLQNLGELQAMLAEPSLPLPRTARFPTVRHPMFPKLNTGTKKASFSAPFAF